MHELLTDQILLFHYETVATCWHNIRLILRCSFRLQNNCELITSGRPSDFSGDRYKSWTIDCGLDYALDYGLDYMDACMHCKNRLVVSTAAYVVSMVA